MRVKILRQPLGVTNGIDLSHYKPRLVYDMPSTLADYLVALGLARFEMRASDRPQPPTAVERRRHKS